MGSYLLQEKVDVLCLLIEVVVFMNVHTDGGESAHRRLMIRLSKRVLVVMTDEYRTTKACPVCKSYYLTIKCPKGNATYCNKYLNKECRREIRGLSYCGS